MSIHDQIDRDAALAHIDLIFAIVDLIEKFADRLPLPTIGHTLNSKACELWALGYLPLRESPSQTEPPTNGESQ